MRCFIAIDVGAEIKEKVIGLQKELASSARLKTVEEKNLHITLKFLGEIPEKTLEGAKKQLSDITRNAAGFDIDIRGFGCFPSLSYIRVLWVGLESDELEALQKLINQVIKIGPYNDKPHLTIARVKSVMNKEKLKKTVESFYNIEIGRMTVKQIKIKKSTLTKDGPVYEDIAVFDLI